MIRHFLTLGLPADASDREIRKRYLELVRQYPPEKDPERFRQATAAYEALKDERSRVAAELFGGFEESDAEQALLSLAKAVRSRKRRAGWAELLEICKKSR